MSVSLVSGIDLVEIKRFREIDPGIRRRFISRVFTLAEQEEAGNRDETYAGKFAAKEAVAKALGCGIGEVRWVDIEILGSPSGQPVLKLNANAALRAASLKITTWSISITHTAEISAAVAIGMTEN